MTRALVMGMSCITLIPCSRKLLTSSRAAQFNLFHKVAAHILFHRLLNYESQIPLFSPPLTLRSFFIALKSPPSTNAVDYN